MTADVITIAFALSVAGFIATDEIPGAPRVDATWAAQAPVIGVVIAALMLCMMSVLFLRGHYNQPLPSLYALRQLYGCCCYAFVVTVMVIFASVAPPELRWLPAIWLLLPPAILGVRSMLNRVLPHLGLAPARIVIVGSAQGIDHVSTALKSDRVNGYHVAGSIDIRLLADPSQGPGRGRRSPIKTVLESLDADSLIVSLNGCEPELRDVVLDMLARETIPFALMPDFGGLPVQGCDTQYFMSHAPMMLMFRNNAHHSLRRLIKDVFDRIVALSAIVLLLPVGVIVAIIVAMDGGPVLFRHTRLGQNGRRFGCFKFRSMAVDADKLLAHTLATDPAAAAEWAMTQKLRDDPRVTRVGRILRSTSIDELPQLLNVLIGDMSLVGPRPIVDAEAARYGKDMELYYRCKPGMTGLWQISGRSDTTYTQRVALDAWYVKNWSLWHDLAILLKTVPALLKREGAV
jgi:undecaprenyl-phosphate galactose phosphotransferase